MKTYFAPLLSLLIVLSCSTKADKEYALGQLKFDVTGSEKSEPVFHKGYLLLHSFEYNDAAEAFQEAQEIDPDFVMAYWGEAMTYNHPIWQEQDLEKGRSTLQKLGKTPVDRIEKAQTEIEKDFIKAVEVLYGAGTKVERDKAYADYMGELYNRYPDNHEVASFYALALLGSVTVGRDDAIYQKSARISEKILKENPKHPGALHYFIHANDDPSHAKEAILVADDYSVVAPDAAHALHMPTHIYLALGMWDKVTRSNENSWQASVTRKQRKKLDNNALGYHSLHWLEYGYLQQGRFGDARKLLENMARYCAELPSGRARSHEVFLKSTYLIETEDWKGEFSKLATDIKELNIATRSLEAFVKGMKSYKEGDITSLEKSILEMEQDRQLEAATISKDGIAVCGSGGASRENATQLDIDISHIMELELKALKAWKQADLKSAEKWLKDASSLEASISYSFGPPTIVKPSHELYGEFLISANHPNEAIEQFSISLQRAPKRILSLKGKLKAAKLIQDDVVVSEIEKQLKEILKQDNVTKDDAAKS